MTEHNGQPQSWDLNLQDIEREELEVDVVLVGAGPASLACAIHLARLLKQKGLEDKTLLVLEKAEDIGYHSLSGAVMDPRGIAELYPDWQELGFPTQAEVGFDCLQVLRKSGKSTRVKGALMPPNLRNHGNHIVSLFHVVRWLKERAEELGVEVYPGFAGAKVLMHPEQPRRVRGVQTRDAGIARDGSRKGHFEPGMDVLAEVTVFGEGTRGSLAKSLGRELELDSQSNAQIYETGVKEVWELPAERAAELEGQVIHTMLEPLGTEGYGGGWVYGMGEGKVSIGFVTGLDHADPKLDPHAMFVRWKQHPFMRELLAGGKVLRYGAKTLPGGGYFSMPKLQGDGFVLVGDTGGFLNMARLKGLHLAIKSGMLAAEAIAEALERGDSSEEALASYTRRFEDSWAKQELWGVRNFRQALDAGFILGGLDIGLQMITGGRGMVARRRTEPDYTTTAKLPETTLEKPQYDDSGSMDKLTDVYLSGAIHEEDQPAHLVITDPAICVERCTEEYGNPCQHFCPAEVYEWPYTAADPAPTAGPVINFSNCVHCKTCDIADPYQIIEWVVPEGGGGPKYIDM